MEYRSAEIVFEQQKQVTESVREGGSEFILHPRKCGEPSVEIPGHVSDFSIFRQQEPEHRTAIFKELLCQSVASSDASIAGGDAKSTWPLSHSQRLSATCSPVFLCCF